MIIALYYGDMKQNDNQDMCLKNLVLSEIFRPKSMNGLLSRGGYFNEDVMYKFKFDIDQMVDELNVYPGVLKLDSNSLYTSIRNLYSLSNQLEIIDIISNIIQFE